MATTTSFLALLLRLFSFSLASRLLGLVRDLSIAWIVGAGPLGDLLAQALRVPHIFRRLLAEGSLSLSLTAHFVRNDCSPRLFLAVRKRLFWLLFFLTALVMVLTKPLARLISADQAQCQALATLLPWALPYLFFAGMAALSMSYLHAKGSFTIPACSPLLFNVLMLSFFWPAACFPDHAIWLIVLGLSFAGLGQWLFQAWAVQRFVRGIREDTLQDYQAGKAWTMLRALPKGLLPAAFPHLAALSAMIFLALQGPGLVSAFFYAERFLELPLGLIGVCLGMASLPVLSSCALRGRFAHFSRSLVRAQHWTLLLILAATSGLCALSFDLTFVLYGHGHFAKDAVPVVASMLILLLPLLPFQAFARILLCACTALGGEGYSLATSLLCLALTTLLGFALHPAFALVLGNAAYALSLWLWLHLSLARKGQKQPFSTGFCCRALVCALLCGCGARGTLALAAWLELSGMLSLGLGLLAGLGFWICALRFFCRRDYGRLKTLLGKKTRQRESKFFLPSA
ncbi:MAG: hypothetical protein IKN64_09080 [Desulfovibrio sp.]|nr:hypothetical protein [Desulfovibrio sp.]